MDVASISSWNTLWSAQDEPGHLPGGECSGARGVGADAGDEPPCGSDSHSGPPHLAATVLQVYMCVLTALSFLRWNSLNFRSALSRG